MALTDENGGFNVSMPVQPMGYGGNYGGNFGVPYAVPVMNGYGYGGGFGNGFGGDWGALIVLFLFASMFGMGGFGGFGGFGGMWGMDGMFPWLLASNANNQNATNAGFDQLSTTSQLSGIQNSITTGFSNAEVAACNRAMQDQANSYNNQIAALNRSFDAQTAVTAGQTALSSQLAQCCCDNRLATESLRATVLAENCEDRNQALLNTRDLLTAGTNNTQAVLDAVRGINDKLCDQELQAERRENQNLRTQLNMANLAASQTAQTARLEASNAAQTAVLQRAINPPIEPAYLVPNPYAYNFGCGNSWNNGFNNFGFNPFGNVGFGNGSF